MVFADVVFPLNIGPLTYRCPPLLSSPVMPGMIVTAPLRRRIAKGVVTRIFKEAPDYSVKDLRECQNAAPVLNSAMLGLLKWMSEYYVCEQGLVLASMLPGEIFSPVKQRMTRTAGRQKSSPLAGEIDKGNLDRIVAAAAAKRYCTFLLHAPSTEYEYSFLMEVLETIKNVIILTPESAASDFLFPALAQKGGGRACLLHGGLSSGERTEALRKITSGISDVVLGARSAVFAPLKEVSCIFVLQEHSSHYKQEKTPYYNARDVAVMRGSLEKSVVILSSISPSVESFFNCSKGKYVSIGVREPMKRPRIRIVNMRQERLVKPYLSKTVKDASDRHLNHNGNILFVVNRRGHSSFLQCEDCTHIEKCTRCGIPFVFHKQDMTIKCHYCASSLPVPQECPSCGSHRIRLAGAGTQKIHEDFSHIAGVAAIRIDRDVGRKKSGVTSSDETLAGKNQIIIGSKLQAYGCQHKFSMAAVFNADLLLNIPDFRSAEKAFQEAAAIIDKVESGGEVLVQTRMPDNYLYTHLKRYDYAGFIQEELRKRKELLYPPFSRLLLMKFVGGDDIPGRLQEVAERARTCNAEILGPYVSARSVRKEFRMLFKSSVRANLRTAVNMFLTEFRNEPAIRIRLDIDPVLL